MAIDRIPLSEFVTLQRGYDLPTQKREAGNFPVVAANGIVGYHNAFKVEAPGVVLGRSGTIGNARFIDEPFWALNTTLFVKDFKGNIPRFVYYVLRSIDFTTFDAGGTVPTLNRNHITNVMVPGFDKETQQAIANFLESLDALIEKNRQISETLESVAQTLFRSWFVDFDPVRAKMAGEKPAGMDDATAALFPDSMVESASGQIPTEWDIETVGNFIPFRYGKSLTASSRRSGEVRVYGSNGVVGEHDEAMETAPVVVVGRKGTVGSVNLSLEPSWVIDTAFLCQTEDPEDLLLGYFSLRQLGLENMNSDAAVPGLNRENAHRLFVNVGTREIRRRFAEIANPLFQEIAAIRKQSATLESIRDALLPRLISGELEVPEGLLVS
jgi:type I restriction enzyme, S subunit